MSARAGSRPAGRAAPARLVLGAAVLALAAAVALPVPSADARRARKTRPAKAGAAVPSQVTLPLTTPSVDAPRGAVAPAQVQARRVAPAAAPVAPVKAGGREAVQRESHIEFDERLVQGQTAAGAIYLFSRGESEFRSMVRLPPSFRERTVRQILPPAQKP